MKNIKFLGILFLLNLGSHYFLMANNQQIERRVTGRVTDAKGEELIGVNVMEEGTANGAITDINGTYAITLTTEQPKLKFSYVGFKEKIVDIDANDNIVNVTLNDDTGLLDEVIVIGYGTTTRRDLTAAVSQVKADDLNKVVSTDISSALKGKAAGIRVFNTTGAPGSQSNITIRGGSSIQRSNAALVIIDGIPGSLSSVAPEDVQSIEILKDAASTAIYGARASNGIILVTTKSGSTGKVIITARTSYGYQNAVNKLDRISTEQYLKIARTAIARSPFVRLLDTSHPAGGGNTASSVWSTRYLGEDETIPAGWNTMIDPVNPSRTLIFQENYLEDQFFAGGNIFDAHVSIRGGSDRVKYLTSLSYTDDGGFVPNSNWRNLTARSNISIKLNNNFTFTSNLSASNSISDRINNENAIFANGIHLAPTIRNRMDDGTIPGGKDTSIRNPFFIVDNLIYNNRIFRFTGKVGLQWDIIDGLYAKADAYYAPYFSHREYFEKKNIYNQGRDAHYFGDIDQTSQFEFTLNYDKQFNEKHKINTVLGASSLAYNDYLYSARARGGSRDDIITLNASTEYTGASSSRSRENLNSVFGRVTYGFNNKFNTSISLRADGSSALSAGNKWRYFPGISAGYIISEEQFMNSIDWISLFKVRTSYGMTGNNNVGRYDYQGIWSLNSSYNGEAAGSPSTIPNKDLMWERSTQFDVGVDLAFLNNKINFNADYYHKITSDLLFSVPIPNTSGFGSITQNVGKVLFWGLEANLNTVIINNKDFGWDFGANISYNLNKVLELPDNGQGKNRIGGLSFSNTPEYGVGGIAEGERMYGVIGYKVERIIDNDAEAQAARYDERAAGWDPKTKTYIKGRKIAGDYEWADKNDDNKITEIDQFVLGYLIPTTTGGFNTTFRYKKFELYTLFDYALGHVIYDRQVSYLMGLNDDGFLLPTKDILNTWRKEGDAEKVKYARVDMSDGAATGQWNHMRTSNMNVFKGDYLALREMKLSYNLPLDICGKLKLSAMNVYVSGRNLYYFTAYPGYSTEYSGSSRNSADSNYPLPRVYSFGAQITF